LIGVKETPGKSGFRQVAPQHAPTHCFLRECAAHVDTCRCTTAGKLLFTKLFAGNQPYIRGMG